MYCVYIIHSEKLNRFYIGTTDNFKLRLRQHNDALYKNAFTTKGIPWTEFFVINNLESKQAFSIEKHIKRNTEKEQSQGLLQNLEDIETCNYPIAGVCIHGYLDAWWKFGLEDSYNQDPNDIEEWFGIVKLIAQEKWYSTEPRLIFFELQKRW